MIVISGALVLIALVLLILGIAVNIVFVYAAIGVAIVSAAFLLFGVFQTPSHQDEEEKKAEKDEGVTVRPAERKSADDSDRDEGAEREGRGKQAAAGVAAAGVGAEAAAAAGKRDEPERDRSGSGGNDSGRDDSRQYDQDNLPEEDVPDGAVAAAQPTGEDIFVVSGHPRFHAQRCPAVGRDDDIEDIDLIEAIELGFTPCGICRPLATLGGDRRGAEAGAVRGGEGSQDTGVAEQQPRQDAGGAGSRPGGGGAAGWGSGAAAMAAGAAVSGEGSPNGSHHREPAAGAERQPARQEQTAQLPQVERQEGQPQPADVPPPNVVHHEAPHQEPAQEEPRSTPTGAVRAAAAGAGGAAGGATTRTTTNPRSVVVVPGRGDYHRPTCERVEGQDGDEMTKVGAIRGGYLACSICRP